MIRDFKNSCCDCTENARQIRQCEQQQFRRLPSAAKTIAQRGSSAKRGDARLTKRYWEIIADNLSKAGMEFGLPLSD